MIRIEDPLNEKGYRILYWIMSIFAFIGSLFMIPPRDGADVLVSILLGFVCGGTSYQLYGWYRENKTKVCICGLPKSMHIEDHETKCTDFQEHK